MQSNEDLEKLINHLDKLQDYPWYIVHYAHLISILRRNKGNRKRLSEKSHVCIRQVRIKLKEAEIYGFEIPIAQTGIPKGTPRKTKKRQHRRSKLKPLGITKPDNKPQE